MSGKLPIIIYDFEKGRQKQVRIIVLVKLKLSCQKLFYKKKKINKNKKQKIKVTKFSLFIEQLPTTFLKNQRKRYVSVISTASKRMYKNSFCLLSLQYLRRKGPQNSEEVLSILRNFSVKHFHRAPTGDCLSVVFKPTLKLF